MIRRHCCFAFEGRISNLHFNDGHWKGCGVEAIPADHLDIFLLVCLVGNQGFLDNRYSGPSVHQDSGWLVPVLVPYDSFRCGFIRQVNQIHRLLLDLFVFVWALPDCMSLVITVKTTELSFLPGPVVGWRRMRLLAV